MGTLFYSPAVRVLIRTEAHGTIDVSNDISSGNVNLTTDAPHSLNLVLTNHRRKYDGIFMPNDRIVLRLKRLRWLQIMSGYLNSVPLFSAFPGSVKLEASCTLKRLKMTYWDPGTVAAVNLLNNLTLLGEESGGAEIEGNLTEKAMAVLTDLNGEDGPGYPWKRDAIHMGRLPQDWINKIYDLGEVLKDSYMLGLEPVVNGTLATQLGKTEDPLGAGPGYGTLPATQGAAHTRITPTVGNRPTFFFTGDTAAGKDNDFLCAMRVGAFRLGTSGRIVKAENLTTAEAETAKAKWKNKKILVVNSENGKSVVCKLVDWGPDPDGGGAIALSKGAYERIGVKHRGQVSIRFADPSAAVGSDGYTSTTSVPTPNSNEPVPSDSGLGTPVAVSTLTWAPSPGGLAANARAASDFVKASWNDVGRVSDGKEPRANKSDHTEGYAIDAMVANGDAATGDRKALGNSIAMWFVANPDVFGTKYVIWYDRINDGNGWRPYTHPTGNTTDDTLAHRDHVHISFHRGKTSAGASGNPWPGGDALTMSQTFAGGFSASGPTGGLAIGQANNWVLGVNPESDILSGERALLNDVPIFSTIAQLINTSMRSFCSAPNGDLIAWFPDYFGHYGLAGKLRLRNIELEDLNMTWTDDHLVTHQFTAGSQLGYGSPQAQIETSERRITTMGIATVEHPEILEALLNLDPKNPPAWLRPDAILQRFGARPDFTAMEVLTSPQAEFWYALHKFQENWANQFSEQVSLSFMPELFPGMLLCLEEYGVQFYVDGVSHQWDLNAGGFSTVAHISAPSTMDGRGFVGMVRGGRVRSTSTGAKNRGSNQGEESGSRTIRTRGAY